MYLRVYIIRKIILFEFIFITSRSAMLLLSHISLSDNIIFTDIFLNQISKFIVREVSF